MLEEVSFSGRCCMLRLNPGLCHLCYLVECSSFIDPEFITRATTTPEHFPGEVFQEKAISGTVDPLFFRNYSRRFRGECIERSG